MRTSRLSRRVIWTVIFCGAMVVSAAQSKDSAAPPRLMPGLGEVHHPVSTKNREAQQFFDQGLKLVYGSITTKRGDRFNARPNLIQS